MPHIGDVFLPQQWTSIGDVTPEWEDQTKSEIRKLIPGAEIRSHVTEDGNVGIEVRPRDAEQLRKLISYCEENGLGGLGEDDPTTGPPRGLN